MMNANPCVDFKWDDLLKRICKQNVIPVLGPGLYTVRTPDAGDTLLYPYLAKKIAEKMGLSPSDEILSFTSVVFQYLEKNPDDYLGLNDFLVELEHLKTIYPVPEGPLWKLARVKSFPLFITTTHDGYLEQVLAGVRDYPTKVIHYTVADKRRHGLDPVLFQELKVGKRSLVYHIYGSAEHSVTPSYTEKDIIETIVTLQKDMELEPENPFFQELKTGSLLFIGCGYDDWLFRFFIRTMTNKPYNRNCDPQGRSFIGDDFETFNCGRLHDFLKAHAAEVYYSGGNSGFVGRLFQCMADRHPDKIIQPDMFTRLVFISFHGKDRDAAKRLAENLKADGIQVWLDERELKPGDTVDNEISGAISRCAVLIPIISKNAQQLQPDDGRSVKYHIREWEWGYAQYTQGQNPRRIMPVKIDDTPWMYRIFDKLNHLFIPSGKRQGEYYKLLDSLRGILMNPNDGGRA
ncbi:MAG TPA: toll/interleukin-1 receptor domain-containing protein [Candidatus Deferrimicrobium sp.]|nr:toll/interleukin-1 receptor domain-containing protein [Candidatus Deferrimicrobium sp.]